MTACPALDPERLKMAATYLREEDFRQRFDIADFVAATRQSFELYGAGQIINPPRQESVEEQDGTSHFRLDMPATWTGQYRVRKIIEEVSSVGSGRLGSREAWIELEDLTSSTQVRLDAGYITDMRTGAAGALAVDFLSGHDVRRVSILGTGRIAHCLALACDHLFDLEQMRCTSRNADNRDAFFAALSPQLHATRLHMTTSIEACIEGADAVLTAIPTPTPVIGQAQLAPVDTIVAIAGDSRTRQLQADVLESRPVVVDLLQQAQKSGEFRDAATQQTLERIALARAPDGTVLTMGDAACGRVARGGSAAYLTGMAAQDLCASVMIYEKLC
ncbi:MAG: hypothetical protein O2782_19800 [bacterium]|nr:hypothetical protein [bacterium]